MFIDLPSHLDQQCELFVAPLAVVRVKSVDEAIERLLEVRPLLVVVYGEEDAPELIPLGERCTDARVVFTVLPVGCSERVAETSLKIAFRSAEAFVE